MKLGFDLNIEQIQKLVMTPELIQAIQILQFNTQELEVFIEDKLLSNPLLDENSKSDDSDTQEKQEYDRDTLEKQEYDVVKEKEQKEEIDWKEYLKEYDDISYKQKEYRDESNDVSFEQFVSTGITLTEHLLFQLQFSISSKELRNIGKYIIESLNSNGYMTFKVEEIAEHFKVKEEIVEETLEVIHTFEPTGVGARSLQECLLIQLRTAQIQDEKLEQIIIDHLHDIADNKICNIAKALDMSLEEVQVKTDLIKKLEPKPGRQFGDLNDVKYIVPDVNVEKIDGKYVIVVKDSTAPKLTINAYYRKMLISAEKESPITDFLTGKLNSALWLIKSIEQRRQTIYNVAKSIIEYQVNFLEYGKKHLKPLTLKQVAEEVGIHESTVSRAVNGKYMQCPRGVFEMKFFFTSGVSNNKGEGVASQSIKTMIEELIDKEDPRKPLSDQAIAKILNNREIDISRRTIAKYRDEMNISSSAKRRRY